MAEECKLNISDKLLQSIKEIGRKYQIDKIVLFGSRARGDSKPTSDVDLAIFGLSDFRAIGRFANDIDDLDTLLKIDLVFVRQDTDQGLMQNILGEGVSIYGRLPD